MLIVFIDFLGFHYNYTSQHSKIYTNTNNNDELASISNQLMLINIQRMGEGKVKAGDVAGAHEKDLAVENKYGVNFLNYWVD